MTIGVWITQSFNLLLQVGPSYSRLLCIRKNNQTARFHSRFWAPGCKAVDTFTVHWGGEINWWALPLHLVCRTIRLPFYSDRRWLRPWVVDRTAFAIPDICQLTEMCLRSTYFQFQDAFFEQVDGAAMAPPLPRRDMRHTVQQPRDETPDESLHS